MNSSDDRRVVLLLQGPMSYFFTYLAKALRAEGAEVHRILLCPGDVLFWRGAGGAFFRGKPSEWQGYLANFIGRHNVTDIAGLGDGRRWHDDGYETARTLGVRVHVIEQGYLRPNFLTVEPEGTGGRTRFPREWDKIAPLATGSGVPQAPRYRTSFASYAAMDVGFNLANLLISWLFFPHYRRHSLDHPVAEWAGWIWNKFIPVRRRRAALAAAEEQLEAHSGPLFVLPLQLDTDYQIRLHAPPGGVEAIMRTVITSFAAKAPADALLVIKVHPLDHGWTNWQSIIAETARAAGCADRCLWFDGGDLDLMLARADGTIVANSTVGLTALQAGSPVIALGTAIYDLPELCFQGTLDRFWAEAQPPDRDRLAVFLDALGTTVHVPGGFDGEGAKPGAEAMAAKMLAPPPYETGPQT